VFHYVGFSFSFVPYFMFSFFWFHLRSVAGFLWLCGVVLFSRFGVLVCSYLLVCICTKNNVTPYRHKSCQDSYLVSPNHAQNVSTSYSCLNLNGNGPESKMHDQFDNYRDGALDDTYIYHQYVVYDRAMLCSP